MPCNDTPPQSPSISMDEEDQGDYDQELDWEQVELVEIIDENGEQPQSDDDDDGEEEEDEITPEVDHAEVVLKKHTTAVLCCDFHPKLQNIVATGGVDEVAYVWDITEKKVLFTCAGHKDTIEFISFSNDGTYLATGDLEGVINIWKTNEYSLVNTFDLESEVTWMQWHHGTNVIVAASSKGMIYMYKVPSGSCKMVMAPIGQSSPCGKILSDGKRVACGLESGALRILDLKEGTVLHEIKPVGECGSMSCLDAHRCNNLIISGYEDGSIIIFNSQTGKVASVLNRGQNRESTSYVEGIAFYKDPTLSLAASCSEDGSVTIWDFSKQAIRHKLTFATPLNHLVWHSNLPLVFVTDTDGVVRCCDAKSGQVVKELLGHTRCCLSLTLSNDNARLMTSSEDKNVRIFPVSDLSIQN